MATAAKFGRPVGSNGVKRTKNRNQRRPSEKFAYAVVIGGLLLKIWRGMRGIGHNNMMFLTIASHALEFLKNSDDARAFPLVPYGIHTSLPCLSSISSSNRFFSYTRKYKRVREYAIPHSVIKVYLRLSSF